MGRVSGEEVSTPAGLCQILLEKTQDEFILRALKYILPPGACLQRDEAFSKIVELAKACDAGVNVSSLKSRFSAVVYKYDEIFPIDVWRVCRLGSENAHVYLYSVVQELKRFSAEELCGNVELFNRAFELSANCFSAALQYYGETHFIKFCEIARGAVAARLEDLVKYVEKKTLENEKMGRPVTKIPLVFVIDDIVENDALVNGVYNVFRKVADNDKSALYNALWFLTNSVKKKGDFYRELCRHGAQTTTSGKTLEKRL